MIGEYLNIVLMCALMTILFFGGWLSPDPGPAGRVLLVRRQIHGVFFFFIFCSQWPRPSCRAIAMTS